MKTNYKSFSKKKASSNNKTSIFADNMKKEEIETFEDKSPKVDFAEEVSNEEKIIQMGKTTTKVYLRQTPSTELDPIIDLDEGEELLIESEVDNDWYQVLTASSREGYIMKQFIELI